MWGEIDHQSESELIDIRHISQYSQKLLIKYDFSESSFVDKLGRYISSHGNCIYVYLCFCFLLYEISALISIRNFSESKTSESLRYYDISAY